MSRKLLICGATGFIGRNLTEYYSKQSGWEVHAVHFNRPAFKVPGVTWHKADLRDPDQIESLMKGVDVVIQAAATTTGMKDTIERPFIHVTDNAVMNSYIFRSAHLNKVKHVVFFSCTVMYQSSDKPQKESDWNPGDELLPKYFGVGHTKMYVERMCEFYSRLGETKFSAIRHSNIYGPYDKYDPERSHVFGATITKVLTAKDKVVVWGTGVEERDLLYVDDLVDFVDKLVANQQDKFLRINCGYGEGLSVDGLVKKIIALSGRNLTIEYDTSKPTIKNALILDCGLAAQKLGWKRRIALDDGIKRTIEWWRANIDTTTLKPKG